MVKEPTVRRTKGGFRMITDIEESIEFSSLNREFEIADVREPNLYREIFPYDKVCKVPFGNKLIPPMPAELFRLSDTTFRDGQQARPPFTVQQIVDLFDLLHRLSGPNGVVRQTEFFLYSDRDREAVERCRERGYRFPEITGWIRANRKDLKRVQEMGLKETGILTSVSDYHIFLKLNKTAETGFRGIPGCRAGGPRNEPHPPLPFRGHDPGRHLRFLRSFCPGFDETQGGERDPSRSASATPWATA